MYAVCGASGNTGRIVAETLLENGKKVRVLGRDKAKLQGLIEKGAEACIGSLEDLDFVKRAFTGVEAAYLMIPPNLAAENFYDYQRKVVEVLSEAVKECGIKYAVVLSSMGADLDSENGPVLGLHWLEQALNKIDGLNALYMRPTFFMENLFGNIPVIKNMGVNGMPEAGDTPIAMIATKDIGDYAAKRLLALDFKGKDFQDLLGPRDFTMDEITQTLGKAIGKPDLPYVTVSYDDMKQGMLAGGLRADIADLLLELHKSYDAGMIKPGRPRDKHSSTPTTIDEFSKTFAVVYNN